MGSELKPLLRIINRIMRLLLVPCLLYVASASIYAQDKMPAPVSIPYTNYLASVSMMLVVMVLLAFFLKKLLPGNKLLVNSKSMVSVIDRIQLEPTVALYLVKMKEKVWLLSVGNKNMQVISEVSSLIEDSDLEIHKPQFSFQDVLDRIVNKKNDK